MNSDMDPIKPPPFNASLDDFYDIVDRLSAMGVFFLVLGREGDTAIRSVSNLSQYDDQVFEDTVEVIEDELIYQSDKMLNQPDNQ